MNIQNIPIPGSPGRRIREALLPRPGEMMLNADYSQVEIRLAEQMRREEEGRGAVRQPIESTRAVVDALISEVERMRDERAKPRE